ncbi:hypothetical protein BDV93DRAFT_576123 [Ceratobasidium sp. AG-I]|nr:hypothetical protein BDV93DRAFT_576123 [Ceratobasidium sp. AG-I]
MWRFSGDFPPAYSLRAVIYAHIIVLFIYICGDILVPSKLAKLTIRADEYVPELMRVWALKSPEFAGFRRFLAIPAPAPAPASPEIAEDLDAYGRYIVEAVLTAGAPGALYSLLALLPPPPNSCGTTLAQTHTHAPNRRTRAIAIRRHLQPQLEKIKRSRSLTDIHSSGALAPSPLRNCALYDEEGLPNTFGEGTGAGVKVPKSEERRAMEGWKVKGSWGQGGSGMLGIETEEEDARTEIGSPEMAMGEGDLYAAHMSDLHLPLARSSLPSALVYPPSGAAAQQTRRAMRAGVVSQDVLLYGPAGVTPAPAELARNNACNKLPPIPNVIPPRQATFYGIQNIPLADGSGRFATLGVPGMRPIPSRPVYPPAGIAPLIAGYQGLPHGGLTAPIERGDEMLQWKETQRAKECADVVVKDRELTVAERVKMEKRVCNWTAVRAESGCEPGAACMRLLSAAGDVTCQLPDEEASRADAGPASSSHAGLVREAYWPPTPSSMPSSSESPKTRCDLQRASMRKDVFGERKNSEWEYNMTSSPGREHSQLEIQANHFAHRPTPQQQVASSQASALSANPNAQDLVGRYPSTTPHKAALQHSSFGSNASGYSTGLPAVPFESIQTGDTKAELSGGMRSLAVDDSGTRPAHNSNAVAHGRAVSYAGGLGVLDVQASGMPMPAPMPSAGAAVRAVSALHHQRSDPSIAQSYGYGQPSNHDYGVYYPSVPVSGRDAYAGFNQYSFGTPAADPSVFGSPIISNAPHRGYSTHNSFYPDPSQAASSYYYTPTQDMPWPV